MFGFSEVGTPDTGLIETQVSDPFKKLIDGEILSGNTFDNHHNFIHGMHIFENPDPLIRERGFRILDKMLDSDPGIKNAYWSRIFTILSEDAEVEPACDACRRSEEIADFVRWNFEVFMQKPIEQFVRMMLDAQRQGFKVAEIIWKVIEDGKYRGMVGMWDLVVRDSRNYSFLTDEHGRLDPMGIIEGLSSTGFQTTSGKVQQLPTNKFIIYTYNQLCDDASSLTGNSDFRVLWRPFYGDGTSHRLELRSAETFARPPLLASVEDGQYTKPEQRRVQKDLAGAYNRTVTTYPNGYKVDELGVARSDQRAFDSLRDRHGRQINNGMMMGATLGGSPKSEAGMMGQHKMFLVVLDGIAADVRGTVMERQVIRRLVDLNYKTNKYPKYLVPKLSIDRNKRAEFIKVMVEKGVIAPDEPWIRKFVNIPKQDLDTRDRQMARKPADDPMQFDLEDSGTMMVGVRGKVIRQLSEPVTIESPRRGQFVLREKDTGRIEVVAKVKENASGEKIKKYLSELTDKEPQHRFLLADFMGLTGGEAILRVVQVFAAEAKDRVVLIG